MKRTTPVLVLLLATAVLAIVLWPRKAGRETPPDQPPTTAPSASAARDEPPARPFERAVQLTDQLEQPGEAPAPLTFGSRLAYDEFPTYLHHYDAVLEFAIQSPFEQLRTEAEEGDGEAAYGVFIYLRFCEIQAPLSEAEVARREEFYINRLVEKPDREEHGWDLVVSSSRHLYEACSQFDRATLRRRALQWLLRAAELNYYPAMLVYLETAEVLVGPVAVYGHPEVIDEYRRRVPIYLSRLLKSGHPDALATVSYLAQNGLLAPPDPLLAYAYLRAAVLIDIEENRWHTQRLAELERKLTTPELRQARELGRELCRRHVPEECGG